MTVTAIPLPSRSTLRVQQFLAFYHLPNGPVTGNPDIAEYSFAGQQVVNENFYTTRLDHKFSEKDSASGTYLFDKTPYTSPDGVNDVLLTTKSARQIAALEETHIFKPTFANSVRFGYNYENVDNNQGAKALVPAAGRHFAGYLPRTHCSASLRERADHFPRRRRRRGCLLLPLEHFPVL